MDINTAEFFYANYLGYMPENLDIINCTEGMISHYLDAKLDWAMTKIYEECAKDKVLSPKNIPFQIWAKDNLIKPNQFYLHPVLKITNPAPIYDPATGTLFTSEYYCEMQEYFSISQIYAYIVQKLNSPFFRYDEKKVIGAIKYCLGRYKKLGEEFTLQNLDILLTTIDCASNNCKNILDITNYEEEAIEILIKYKNKLEALNKYQIQWRKPCQCLLN